MSYKRAIEQLRPVRYPKQDVQEKTQSYLTEAFTVPITTSKDAKKYKLEKLFNYLKKKNYDEIPLVVDPSNGQYKIRGKEAQRFKVDGALEADSLDLSSITASGFLSAFKRSLTATFQPICSGASYLRMYSLINGAKYPPAPALI